MLCRRHYTVRRTYPKSRLETFEWGNRAASQFANMLNCSSASSETAGFVGLAH